MGVLDRAVLPRGQSRSKRLHKNKGVTILGMKCQEKVSLKPNYAKLAKLLRETERAPKKAYGT